MFGGQAGTKFFNDVWSFDVVSEQWSQIKTAGTAPAARSGTAAAVDPELDQLIISHGVTAAGLTADTWTLDLVTKVWQNVSPASGPTARSQHTATFDEIHHRFILFGGMEANGRPSNEQWSLDPAALVWRQFGTITASNPAPRSGAALIYEPIGFVIYLFGGKTGSGLTNEVWSLDPLNHWTSIGFGSGPVARTQHAATWDTTNARLIVFGGVDANNKLQNDLWAFTP
jgi:N-acetylneuraminic acid mutarotase